MKDNLEEIFPLVDEEGTVVGKATRGECHNGSRLLHAVVHLHVFNSAGEVYLQKRPEWKDIQPGKWDTAVGGHIDYGETPKAALRREVREELGTGVCEPHDLRRRDTALERRVGRRSVLVDAGDSRCHRTGCADAQFRE